ncbi:MAG: hypothetical protein ABSE73_00210 [Planctomycetota bacterium]
MTRTAALIALCLLLPGSAPGGEMSQRRTAERQTRMSALRDLPEALKRSNEPYLAALGSVCQWLIGLQAKDEAGKLLAEMDGLNEKNSASPALKKSLEAIAAPAALDEAKQKELATRLKAARTARAAALANLAATYHRASLPRTALGLVMQALDSDPNNAVARQALGQVLVGTEWKDAFAAQQIQKGNVYVPDMGWVQGALAERAKKGEWCENGRWMPIDEADKLHKDTAKPWTIETQHFNLVSTAPRKISVQVAAELDGLRQACNREYLDFFMRERRSPQMQFTQPLPKKMLVHFFGEKPDYDAVIKKEFKNQLAVQIILLLLPGIYSATTHASYFNQAAPEPFRTLFRQNQVASQILSEYTQAPAGNPKAWIGTSVCGSVQYALPDDAGHFSLPVGHKHPAVGKAAEMLQQGTLPPLATLFTLDAGGFWNPLMPGNSEAISAFCRFLMDTKDGAYALDFQEFVYDSYKGVKNASLNDYLGMDNATLEQEFHEYLKQQ